MNLSAAFIEAGIEKPAVDLIVKIYNINKGKNLPIAEKSRSLDDYSTFIDKIREYQAELKNKADGKDSNEILEEAVKKAVYWCIEHDIMKSFLEENATEVKNMVMGEWDMDTALEVAKEEGWEEGREEGKEEGWEECLEDVLELVRQGYSAEVIERKLQNRKGNTTTTA